MNFLIKKKRHYSNNLLYKLFNFFNFKNILSFKVTFDSSVEYNDDSIDRLDINKLFGFSCGFHHKNSARFGWNFLNNKIFIYSYCYVNGERKTTYLTTILPNTECIFTIEDHNSYYLFTIIDKAKVIESKTTKDKKHSIGYKLWPYFGGNKVAPHNMKFKFKKYG